MAAASMISRPTKRHPVVARIVRQWRILAAGRRTMVACSGGADSSALVLAVSAVSADLVIGHIVHDMRSRAEAVADRDRVRELAAQLGIEMAEGEASVASAGGENAELAARRLRYAALADLAAARGCPVVATGHHADDQLETVLMGLVRGAGLYGLAGVAPMWEYNEAVTIVRPMLGMRRADAERLCRDSNWRWAEDATNEDRSFLRAAIRHGAARDLAALRPGAAMNAARSARLLRDAAELIDDQARALLARARVDPAGGGPVLAVTWDRSKLRNDREILIGAAVREAIRLVQGDRGMDRATGRVLEPVIAAVRDNGTNPRRFVLRGVTIEVTAHQVAIRRRTGDA